MKGAIFSRMDRLHCSACRLPIPAVPESWSGSLGAFIQGFIERRLPSPDRLSSWATWIVEGIRTADVVVVRRFAPLIRGVPHDIGGLRVLPSDLSPVWALQHLMLHSDPPSGVRFDDWTSTLPLEHNDVRGRKLDVLNVAGFPAAHLVNVAALRKTGHRALEADELNPFYVATDLTLGKQKSDGRKD